MAKTVNTKIQVRRDTSANWSSNNPVLASGEIGYDTTNKKIKIGDGSTAWNSLDFTVPTNVSAFTNDAGYLTSYTETDPTVPAWAKTASKPTYTANEISGLGAAASKAVDTTISAGSTSTNIPTSAAVVNYISQNPPAVDPSDLFSFDADTGLLIINIE